MANRSKRVNTRNSLIHSDPGKVMDLVMNLTDDNCAQLQIKINNYFMEQCESEMVFLLEIEPERMEAGIQAVGSTVLSRKYKLSLASKFIEALKNNTEISDLVSNSGQDLLRVISPYLSGDDSKKRIFVIPIYAKPYSVLVCVISPTILEQKVSSLVHECFTYVWPVLKNSLNLEYEITLKQKCQQLLRVARQLFTQVASLETLLQMVMEQAKQLTRAEYCGVYLIDVDTMELVETYFMGNIGAEKKPLERRFSTKIGIIGQVLSTGCLVNARAAHDHPAFDASIDEHHGVESKTMLSFPIRDQTGIIGIGQLINKIGDPYFDAMDEETALAFSVYCGVCIVHSVIYKKMQEAHIRSTLANELVMYHLKVTDAEVARVTECTGFHDHPHVVNLNFNTRALPLRELPCYAVKMFMDLNFHQKFNIKIPKLIRFVLLVKKGYRELPFHSWYHGFNVAQWAYAAIVNYKLIQQGYLSDLQALMYLVASLVHDVDHRGTTNNFQVQGNTMLSVLYSSEGSILERHHLSQAMCMLNTEGCDILESLPRRDYDRALLMLKDYILATDLANYFKNRESYHVIAQDYQKSNRSHNAALQALLMNAADLSDQLKEWSAVKKMVAALLTEFFHEGDVGKSRGVLPPMMMDRDQCIIPEMEIQFLTNVCLPLYRILGLIIPKAQSCCTILESHVERWEASKPVFAEVPVTAGMSVLLSPELDNLIDINIKEKELQERNDDANQQ